MRPASDRRLVAYPVGAGRSEEHLADARIGRADGALASGRRSESSLQASEPSRGPRIYLQDGAGGQRAAFTPEGYRTFGIKAASLPTGGFMVLGPDRKVYRYPAEGGEPSSPPGSSHETRIQRLGARRSVRLRHRDGASVPLKVSRVDLATGERELVRELMPSDAAGVARVGPVLSAARRKVMWFSDTRGSFPTSTSSTG